MREVVVSIGEATLVLSDPKSDAPLTHWSLPAIRRVNPGEVPATYIPAAAEGDDQLETLELDDKLMIEAISRVQAAIAARRPHPGRLRGGLMRAGAAMMLSAAALWLPPALRSHAARITPPAERLQIGTAILADMSRATGQPCRDPAADQVLRRMSQRLGLPQDTQITVMRESVPGALMLPGHIAVTDNTLIAGQPGPEALAGHLLAARITAAENDPLRAVIARAPFSDVLALLTRGTLSPAATHGLGESLLAAPASYAADAVLLDGFAAARIPATPFAETLGGARQVALIEADPFRVAAYPVILNERDWVTLQQICVDRG
ncbi:MAG: hypothetical protein Q4G25_00015 [Paracoccus sp. (in: a-proteobacteria)]|nr:hypothetical protein [Paracoccus sp. (in: a-proteobacteria)]